VEKRFQVFVSSTFLDLQEERQEVMQALLELDCIPAGMELFPASNQAQWELIKKVIDDCDYYVLIVGGRYGHMTDAGISYTEMEFDYAAAASKPILAFLHADPDQIVSGKTDRDPAAIQKLEAFRRKVKTDRLIREWRTPEELGSVVSRSLVKAMKATPAEGWVRARYGASTELLEQLNALRDQNDKLKADIKKLKVAPPDDAVQYAGGSDLVTLHGTYRTGDYRNPVQHRWKVRPTWDEIFYELGPELFGECPESKMRAVLAEEFAYWDENTSTETEEMDRFHVSDDSFQTIKVQLFALGLIQRGSQKRGVGDRATYWMLTSYGEDYLMKLRARKKGDAVDQPSEPKDAEKPEQGLENRA
jgi:uncharacterized protein DUF4062